MKSPDILIQEYKKDVNIQETFCLKHVSIDC